MARRGKRSAQAEERRERKYARAVVRVIVTAKSTGPKRRKELLFIRYERRNGQWGEVCFSRKKNGKWERETVSRQPVKQRETRRFMPRIGGGTGQTERKMLKIVTERETYDYAFGKGGVSTPAVKLFKQTYSYTREEIMQLARELARGRELVIRPA